MTGSRPAGCPKAQYSTAASSGSFDTAMGDPSSSANFDEVAVKHFDWRVEADFSTKKLQCSLDLRAVTLKEGVAQLVLDVHELTITSVVSSGNGGSLPFEIQKPKESVFGSTLCITLSSSHATKGAEVKLTIQYETSPTCTAVQWLQPAQTAGKMYPYLFTQCQPIHARSMLPCQDTPAIKTTFSAEVVVPAELTALMGAEGIGSEPHATDSSKKVFRFQQKVPIPSYLTALVVGALESRRIGPRSHVWSEGEVVDKAAWEFQETDQMLQAAEEIAGEYLWGKYDLLVLPPSFPYGGMENPNLTFVSPTLLAGDRSLANVVAHEVSHSWTGNLVTNKTWEQFWLNEGITTYLERKIVARLHGEQERHLHAMDGWKSLQDAVGRFQKEGKYQLTALVPKLSGVHPDDAFSCIPYEKGSAFLFYLETLLGGPGSLDEFLKAYVKKFKYLTITSEEWKEFFLQFFSKEAGDGVFDQVEWDKWFYEPGMPPYTPQYDTTLADASKVLADKWAHTEATEVALSQFSPTDIKEMTSRAVQEFLNQLLNKPPLAVEVLCAMDKNYTLSKKENSEIKCRWLKLCLKSKWKEAFPYVVDFITKQGRMKFVRPLYQDLFACDEEGKDLAVSTFTEHKEFYHGVAATLIAKDLKLN